MEYLTFDIQAIEDLKVGSAGSQIDNEYSLDYLPGTSIRGAVIKKYIQKHRGIDISEDEKSRKLLLEGGIKFLNAYKVSNQQATIPFPLCFYTQKDVLKKYDGTGVVSPVINELDTTIEEDYKKIKLGSFARFDRANKKLFYTTVEKNYNLHITKQVDENNLFRYEAIKRGQVFKGVLAVENKQVVEEIKELLEEQVFYIGGSKGSGYGKCYFQNVCLEDDYSQRFIMTKQALETFYIVALSDILYLNSEGAPSGSIESQYIQNKLGLEEVELTQCITETTIISGYNVKWGSRLPQYKGIKAGSLFKYTIKKGSLKPESVQKLVEQGIGLRTQEGFGQIAIWDSLEVREVIKENEKEEKDITLVQLNSADKAYLQHILLNVYKQQVNKAIDTYICKQLNSYHIKPSSRNNQLGNLLELINELKGLESKEGIQRFNEYIAHLRDDRKLTQHIYQLEDVKIGKQSLVEYMEELMSNSENVNYFNKQLFKLPSVAIGDVDIQYNKQLNYENTLQLLEHLIRYIVRIRGHKGEK